MKSMSAVPALALDAGGMEDYPQTPGIEELSLRDLTNLIAPVDAGALPAALASAAAPV